MAIALRSQGAPAAISGASSIVLDVPSGVQSGDYLIAFIHQQNGDTVDVSSSGWTRIGPVFNANDTGVRVTGFFAKFATGSEPSTYAFTTSSTGRATGFMAAYTGVHTTAPVAHSSTWTFSATSVTTLSVPADHSYSNMYTLEIWAANFASPDSYALSSYTGGLAALGTGFAPAGTENTALSRSAMRVWEGTAPTGGMPAHVITSTGTAQQACTAMLCLNPASIGLSPTTTPTVTGHTTTVTNGSSATFTMNPATNLVGTAVATGDWIIAVLTSGGASATTAIPTPPAGWTNLVPFGTVNGNGTMSFGVWAHKRAVSETTYTWTQTTGQASGNATRLIFVSGAADIAYWFTGYFAGRTTTTTNVAPSVTTVAAHSLGLLISGERTIAAETDPQVTSTNFTKQWFDNSLVDHTAFVATKDIATAGATGASTVTYPNTHVANGIAGILAIPGVTGAASGLTLKVSNGSSLVDARFKLADGAGGFVTPGAYKVVKPGYATVTQMLAQTTFYCAHRGGSYDFPEMSMYAYGQSALAGFPALEISLARTSDGVWFGLHDASLDRTSLGTGGGSGTTYVASSMTWAQVQTHTILGSSATGNPTQADRPYMRWEELMAMYYHSHVIFVDPKAALSFTAELLNMMDALPNPTTKFIGKYYGVSGATNNSTGWCHDAQVRGYKTWGYFYAADAANYATYGPHWDIVGMDYNAAQTYWDQLAAAAPGKPIMGHICPNPAAVTTALGKGANGVMVSGAGSVVPPVIT